MSSTTAIDNFTVTSEDVVIPGGTVINDTVSTGVNLTLSPNKGYQIEEEDFSVNDTSSPQVDWENCVFTQAGENIVLTVVFHDDAVMPEGNLDIKICASGSSAETGVQISGEIVYTTTQPLQA